MGLNPVIDDPSKPIPPSKASSISAALIENDLSCPRTSVNHSRMKRTSRSSTTFFTSSGVWVRTAFAVSAIWSSVSRVMLVAGP